jgi:hypothetical protein
VKLLLTKIERGQNTQDQMQKQQIISDFSDQSTIYWKARWAATRGSSDRFTFFTTLFWFQALVRVPFPRARDTNRGRGRIRFVDEDTTPAISREPAAKELLSA